MPTRRRITPLVSTLLGASVALVGCTAVSGQPPAIEPVTLGLLTDAASDPDAVRGAQLAVDLVNEAHPDLSLPLAADAGLPGLRGAGLTLVVGDTAGRAETAEAAVRELITEQRAVAIVAADSAEVLADAAADASARKTPVVDCGTSAGYLLDLGLDWYFRTAPTDRMLSEAALAVLMEQAGGGGSHRLMVMLTSKDRGRDMAAQLTELARGAGFTDTATVTLTDQPADVVSVTDSDFIVAVAPTTEDMELVRAALTGWDVPYPVIGIGRGFAGTYSDRILHVGAWSADLVARQPVAQAVADLYQHRFQTAMGASAAGAFTATLATALAVDAAATTDREVVRAALRQLSIPATATIMPWNGIRFAENGQNELAAAIVEQSDGTTSWLVYPRELALADVVWEPPSQSPASAAPNPPPAFEDRP